ncbi:WDR26 [Cordylochernes scorpioides]|uniref:WDR26 n=1 Tax=Cordylochernes scorpioides TaxID=51811 RepID=A0ABY6K2X0_9ARAC|nr:WDR26 [Cordylochernes scorpioides]
MKFLLLQEKYLESLDEGHLMNALNCLRHEITPLQFWTSRVHELSSYMMCSNSEELRATSKWAGKSQDSREKLMEKLQGPLFKYHRTEISLIL